MANIPSSLDSWSTTAASNQPDSTDTATIQADLQQILATVRSNLAFKGSDIASSGTTDLSAATGNFVDITGTTTITAFGTLTAGMWKFIRFTGALTLTHNATSLILPGAANIATANGDTCIAMSLGAGNWKVMHYQKADGGVISLASPPAIGGTTPAAGTFTALTATGNTVLGDAATDTVALQAGSASLPALIPNGDPNTGVWFPAADAVAVSTGGAERMRIDASGNVLVTNTAGLGYGTGAGGAVTQLTSKSTGVTLNKPCGQITMHNAALAAGASIAFQLTNSLINGSSTVIPNVLNSSVSDGANYQVWAATDGGAAKIIIKNVSAGSLSEAVVISFAIIRGVTN
jgi:hypothetical protein